MLIFGFACYKYMPDKTKSYERCLLLRGSRHGEEMEVTNPNHDDFRTEARASREEL